MTLHFLKFCILRFTYSLAYFINASQYQWLGMIPAYEVVLFLAEEISAPVSEGFLENMMAL